MFSDTTQAYHVPDQIRQSEDSVAKVNELAVMYIVFISKNIRVFITNSGYCSNEIKIRVGMLCIKLKRSRIISVQKVLLSEKRT